MKRRTRTRRRRHPRRRTSPPRSRHIVLRPGQRLVTSTVIVIARMAGGGVGVTTDVTCECTKSEPDKPDCQPSITRSPGGGTVRVTCKKSGGCKTCKQTTTTTGVVMA